MLNLIKKFLLVILAALQLFAPLVHAHTGNSHFHGGIHMPGMESYLDNHHAASLSNVNTAWQTEGLLVLVDVGIKHSHDLLVNNTGDQEFLPRGDVIFPVPVNARPQNFSPHIFVNLKQDKFLSPHSPRAPPHLAIA